MLNLCTLRYNKIEVEKVLQKIGIREFRTNLAKYLNSTSPIAVMRYGQTVGYFLPAHQEPEQAELEALKLAAQKLDELLAEKEVSEDELLNEFRQLREQDR